MMLCDLHLHSDRSDGSLSVPLLVRAVREAGVTLFSLTDHDTVAGLAEAEVEASRLGLKQVTGIEVSTNLGSLEFHILGYGFDPNDLGLALLLAARSDHRHRRVRQIVEKLRQLGLAITVDDVEACARASVPGRPHVARALLRRGCVRDLEEAFSRYLADGGAAYVPKLAPTPAEAIATLHAAGGRAVWAHPLAAPIQCPGGFDSVARELAAWGLDGVEVVHPSHSEGSRRRIFATARELGLALTGGSDFHGTLTPGVSIGRGYGGDRVPSSWAEALLGGIRAPPPL